MKKYDTRSSAKVTMTEDETNDDNSYDYRNEVERLKDENKIIREEVEALKKEISNRTEEFNTKLIEKDREIKECQDEIAAFKEQNRKH